MNPMLLIQIATALATLTRQLVPAVLEAQKVLSSNDRNAVSAALQKLQDENDALYAATMAALQEAAKK